MKKVTHDINNTGIKKYPIALLKFSQKEEYLADLVENGNLYFSTMKNFRAGNDAEDEFTNDPFEGATSYINIGPGTMSTVINEKRISFEFIKFTAEPPSFFNGNITCLYSITKDCFKDNEMIPIDSRMGKGYKYFVFINNYYEFIRRFEVALDILEINCRHGHVEYYNELNYSNQLNPHSKRSKYEFQNELRIYLDNIGNQPLTINIGSLKDIARIHPVEIVPRLRATIAKDQDVCTFRIE